MITGRPLDSAAEGGQVDWSAEPLVEARVRVGAAQTVARAGEQTLCLRLDTWSGPAARAAAERRARLLQRCSDLVGVLARLDIALEAAAGQLRVATSLAGQETPQVDLRDLVLGAGALLFCPVVPQASPLTDPTTDLQRLAARRIVEDADEALALVLRRLIVEVSGQPDPEVVRWQGLTPAEQEEEVRERPDIVGATDGLPAWARDAANRIRLDRDEADLSVEAAALKAVPEEPDSLWDVWSRIWGSGGNAGDRSAVGGSAVDGSTANGSAVDTIAAGALAVCGLPFGGLAPGAGGLPIGGLPVGGVAIDGPVLGALGLVPAASGLAPGAPGLVPGASGLAPGAGGLAPGAGVLALGAGVLGLGTGGLALGVPGLAQLGRASLDAAASETGVRAADAPGATTGGSAVAGLAGSSGDASRRAAYDETADKLAAVRATRAVLEQDDERVRQLLDVDVSGRQAEVVVSVGDVDRAKDVAVVVDGFTTTVQQNLQGADRSAAALADVADRQTRERHSADKVAVVTWFGYDTPQWSDGLDPSHSVVSRSSAEAGSVDLSEFVVGLAAVAPDRRTTLVAHSYGSTTAGLATARGTTARRRAVDDLVVMGSPGLGVSDPSRLHLAGGRVHVLEAPGDVVADLGWFGRDPGTVDGFDQLDTGDSPAGTASHGHSEYLTPGTTSQANVAAVVTGTPRIPTGFVSGSW